MSKLLCFLQSQAYPQYLQKLDLAISTFFPQLHFHWSNISLISSLIALFSLVFFCPPGRLHSLSLQSTQIIRWQRSQYQRSHDVKEGFVPNKTNLAFIKLNFMPKYVNGISKQFPVVVTLLISQSKCCNWRSIGVIQIFPCNLIG